MIKNFNSNQFNNSLNYLNDNNQSKNLFDSQKKNNLKNIEKYKNKIIKEDVKKFLDEIFNYCFEAIKYEKISLYKKNIDNQLNEDYLYIQIKNKDKEINELKKELNKYKYSYDLLKEENKKLMNFINFLNKMNNTNNIYNNINIKNIINKGNININENFDEIKNKNNFYENKFCDKNNKKNPKILNDENSNDFIFNEKTYNTQQINHNNNFYSFNQEKYKNKTQKGKELTEQNYFLNHEILYKNLLNYKYNKKYE